MNIALLSNSLVNRTLAFNLDYVLNEQVENILLPAENHSVDETLYFGGKENILICSSVDDAVSKGDIIIASNKNTIARLPETKRSIFVTNPWAEEIENIPESEVPKCTNIKPKIAVLSLGRFADQYYTEILVNKILFEIGAKIHQIYSKETRSILSELTNQGILNKDIWGCEEDKADIMVVSIDGTKFHNDAEFICDLNRLSPDMLFVCIDRTIEAIDVINNIIGIVRQVNLTIRSPYISYDVGTGVKYPVYCGFIKDNTSVSSLDAELESHLKKQIMKCLYFPTGTLFF